MNDLTTKIRNAAAFSEDKVLYEQSPEFIKCFLDGAEHQHAQNKWAFEALLIAYEAIDFVADYKSWSGPCTQPCFEKVKRAREQIAALVPKGDDCEF